MEAFRQQRESRFFCKRTYSAHVNCGCFPGVACVLLEGKAQNGDLLAGNGIEHGVNHALYKALLLIVVDVHHLQDPYLVFLGITAQCNSRRNVGVPEDGIIRSRPIGNEDTGCFNVERVKVQARWQYSWGACVQKNRNYL